MQEGKQEESCLQGSMLYHLINRAEMHRVGTPSRFQFRSLNTAINFSDKSFLRVVAVFKIWALKVAVFFCNLFLKVRHLKYVFSVSNTQPLAEKVALVVVVFSS